MSKHLAILVHGIASSNDTWSKFVDCMEKYPDKKIKKCEELLATEESDCFYIPFGYQSAIFDIIPKKLSLMERFSGVKKSGDISILTHSETLLSEIRKYAYSYDKISFIVHSMGGLVLMFTLFHILEEHKELLEKIGKLIIYASPFAGSQNIDDLQGFFGVKKINTAVSSELSQNSSTIALLNDKIMKHKDKLKELDFLYLYGIKDGRIAEQSLDIAKIFCETEYCQFDHNKIKEPNNYKELPFAFSMKFLFDEYPHKVKRDNSSATNTAKGKKLTKEEIVDGVSKTVRAQTIYKENRKRDDEIEEYLMRKWNIAKSANIEHDPFIILSSHYTHTLYANSCYMGYLVYNIKMVEDGTLSAFSVYLTPFDKEKLSREKEKNPLCCNQNADRFQDHIIKGKVFPCSIGSAEFLKPTYTASKNGDTIMLSFDSEVIPKGTELRLEISISDKICRKDTPESKIRREEYFSFNINNEKSPHGKRFISWQLETFKDVPGEPVALPYEPQLKLNKKQIPNKNNCKQTIYYKRWDWEFDSIDEDVKKTTIHLKLNESASHKNGVPCADS